MRFTSAVSGLFGFDGFVFSRYRYLLEAVIEAEKIEVTDKEAEDKAEEMAKDYGMVAQSDYKGLHIEG